MKRFVVVVALSGCAGLDTGNAVVTSIKVAVSVGPGTPVDSTGAQFGIDSAFVNVRDVELYLPAGMSCADIPDLDATIAPYTLTCDSEKIRARGPWRFDLLSKTATPELPTLSVLPGTYTRIDVELEPDDNDVTLEMTGVVPLNGQSTPYRMRLAFDERFRFEGTPIEATTNAVAQALLTLDATQWFQSVPIAECAAEGELEYEDGVLLIEDGGDGCEGLESKVRGHVGESCSLDRDDGDDDADDHVEGPEAYPR